MSMSIRNPTMHSQTPSLKDAHFRPSTRDQIAGMEYAICYHTAGLCREVHVPIVDGTVVNTS